MKEKVYVIQRDGFPADAGIADATHPVLCFIGDKRCYSSLFELSGSGWRDYMPGIGQWRWVTNRWERIHIIWEERRNNPNRIQTSGFPSKSSTI